MKNIGRMLGAFLCALVLTAGFSFGDGCRALAASAPDEAASDAEASSAPDVENADEKYDKYIAFGADLSPEEKSKIMGIFGLSEADLADYQVIEITNEDEHNYLGDYLDASVIGTRALSSVKIVKTEDGSGISVSENNINYCTTGMYCNALITAGLSDVAVTVAAPFPISGTSALVGAMKAYSVMTGQDISEETMDTATDELVTTAQVAEDVGDTDKVVQLVAAAKQRIFEEELSTQQDIRDAITASADALNIDLSDEDVDKLTDMLMKVSEVDVDADAIKEQASELYEKLKDAGIDLGNVDTKGLAQKVGDFFANIFGAIKDFFKGLFG